MTTKELRKSGVYAITLHTPGGTVHMTLGGTDTEITAVTKDGTRLWDDTQILAECSVLCGLQDEGGRP